MKPLSWRDVYDFWFPSELEAGDLEFHRRMAAWWMRGGATPELPPFASHVAAAATGELDHWAEIAEGRLALIIVLDQFPRGMFAGAPEAYACDNQALRLCEEGLANGHYDELQYPWERFFFTLPLLHAEGPDHLSRLNRLVCLAEAGASNSIKAFPALRPVFEFSMSQTLANLDVISRFGRFPHRNHILARPSTPEELAYIAKGDFVHLRSLPDDGGNRGILSSQAGPATAA